MSGIAGQEIILIIIIGLIVLGPKRLPQVANQVGSWIGQARRMTRMMKRQLEDEVNFDLRKELGIDEHGNPIPSSTVAAPGYVHSAGSKKQIHGDDTDSSDTGGESADAAVAEEPAPDLPDDYSPAHAADDVGTGVGDEPACGEHDELDAVLEAAGDSDTEPAVADVSKPAEPGKKAPA